ncbi:MAG: hypothetical protein ACR2PT_22275 [Endozoicomonas sp.]
MRALLNRPILALAFCSLLLTQPQATTTTINQDRSQFALIESSDNTLCLLRDEYQHTWLECLSNTAWLKPATTLCFPDGRYLETCPDKVSQLSKCTVITMESATLCPSLNTSCFSDPDFSHKGPPGHCQTHAPPALGLLWHEIVEAPCYQVYYFFRHSLDDIVEDTFGISAALSTALILYHYQCQWLVIIATTIAVHALGNAIGDHVSNLWEDEQEHIHSRHWLSTMASNLVEDYVKANYFAWEFSGFISTRLLLHYGSTLANRQVPPINIPGKVRLISNALSGLSLMKESYQLISNYNWMNQRADALGDEARCMVNALFEYLFPEQ